MAQEMAQGMAGILKGWTKKGKEITLAGEIVGKETKPLGKTEYTYPVVLVKQLHLWKRPYYGRHAFGKCIW